jgi:hypothetical protein
MRGSYSEGTLEAATDIVWRRPSLRRVNIDAPGFKCSEGFDAFTWELNLGTGKFVRDTGAAADAGRRGAGVWNRAMANATAAVVRLERFIGCPASVKVVLARIPV